MFNVMFGALVLYVFHCVDCPRTSVYMKEALHRQGLMTSSQVHIPAMKQYL